MADFGGFYEEYAGQVYRFLLSLTRDGHLAEELTQETFYQAFLHTDQFEGRCAVTTWLCQIGKNAYFKECRRRRRLLSLSQERPAAAPDPVEALAERDQVARLRLHLGRLSEPYREVFTLHIFGEVSYQELALLFGKSVSWARVTCYRAKEELLRRLEEEDGR